MIRKDAELILTDKIRLEAMKNLSSLLTDYMMDIGMFRTCLNCAYWNEKNETCQYYKQKPPAKVIVCGCETHTDIPF